MDILILSIYFDPETTGNAPYVTGLAHHLAQRHRVTVIAGMPHYPEWEVHPGFPRRRRLITESDRLRVIRIPHYVPRKQDAVRRLAYEASWAVRAIPVARRVKAEVVIAFMPALLTGCVATAAARSGAPTALVVQDLVARAAQHSGMRGGRRASRLAFLLERFSLRSATAVATIHPRLRDVLIEEYGIGVGRVETIYNWAHIDVPSRPRLAVREELGWLPDETIALHSGNMGLKQNLELLVKAARRAEALGKRIRFVLAGDGSQRAMLEVLSRGVGNIEVRPGIEESGYADFLHAADVLLVCERKGALEMSIPSKLTSYLSVGRPVVAVTDPRSATAELVRTSGAGVVVAQEATDLLLAAVERFASDDRLARECGRAGQEFARRELSSTRALSAYESWLMSLV